MSLCAAICAAAISHSRCCSEFWDIINLQKHSDFFGDKYLSSNNKTYIFENNDKKAILRINHIKTNVPYAYEKRVLSYVKFSIPNFSVCWQRSKSRKKWMVCWRGFCRSRQHSIAVQVLLIWQFKGTEPVILVIFQTANGQSTKYFIAQIISWFAQ
jgi:hypothetical protein